MGGDSSSMTMIVLLVAFMLLMFWMSRSAKKRQQLMETQRDEALVIGANVRTHGGFYGKVVDIDGDAITLESPSGTETVWFRGAIQGVAEIPFAPEPTAEITEIDETPGPDSGGGAVIDHRNKDK